MKNTLASVLLLTVGLLSPSSYAQSTPETPPKEEAKSPKLPYIPRYGANIGWEQILSSSTRDVFGNGGISFSPGFGSTFVREGLTIRPGFNLLNIRKKVDGDTNRATLLWAGPNFRYGFVSPFRSEVVNGETALHFRRFVPFLQAGLGLVYSDIKVPSQDISKRGFAFGASLTAGTSISERTFLQVRYRYVPKIASYEFSTLGVQFGVRF